MTSHIDVEIDPEPGQRARSVGRRIADMRSGAPENYPLEPVIVLEMATEPAHSLFSRELTFQDHAGLRMRLTVAFTKTGPLRWESDSYPDGLDALTSLVDQGNRSYWDSMVLENRGGARRWISRGSRSSCDTPTRPAVHRSTSTTPRSRSWTGPSACNCWQEPTRSTSTRSPAAHGTHGRTSRTPTDRWLPGDPAAASTDDRYNRAIVLNGPWPVTLRLVHIHQDELNEGKDFWLGRID